MMMKKYQYAQGVFSIEGAVSLEEKEGAVSPWKIWADKKYAFPYLSEPIGQNWAGCRIALETDGDAVGIELIPSGEERLIDLWINGKFAQTKVVEAEKGSLMFEGLESGEKRIELWIDQRSPSWVKGIFIPEGAFVRKYRDTRRRWVHYGSSISQSCAGGSPSEIWSVRASRELGLHLTNLGMNGNCVLEPMMGRVMERLPADLYTMALGINVDVGHYSARSFGPSTIGLIETIRRSHPITPIVIISPIVSLPREHKDAEGTLRMNLTQMREILSQLVETYRSNGDENLYYIDGLSLFGEKEACYLPDELHPNKEGQPVLAEHFMREIKKLPLGY